MNRKLLTIVTTVLPVAAYIAGYAIGHHEGKSHADRWWHKHPIVNYEREVKVDSSVRQRDGEWETLLDKLAALEAIHARACRESEHAVITSFADGDVRRHCEPGGGRDVVYSKGQTDVGSERTIMKRKPHRRACKWSDSYMNDDLTVTWNTEPTCNDVKMPFRVMLDIVNANPGDYGWFHIAMPMADGSSQICARIDATAVDIQTTNMSRIDEASCLAQDWAASGGKATVEIIKKP